MMDITTGADATKSLVHNGDLPSPSAGNEVGSVACASKRRKLSFPTNPASNKITSGAADGANNSMCIGRLRHDAPSNEEVMPQHAEALELLSTNVSPYNSFYGFSSIRPTSFVHHFGNVHWQQQPQQCISSTELDAYEQVALLEQQMQLAAELIRLKSEAKPVVGVSLPFGGFSLASGGNNTTIGFGVGMSSIHLGGRGNVPTNADTSNVHPMLHCMSHGDMTFRDVAEQRLRMHLIQNPMSIGTSNQGAFPIIDANNALFLQTHNNGGGGHSMTLATGVATPEVIYPPSTTASQGFLPHQALYAREDAGSTEIVNPVLYMSHDDVALSDYQCLVRKQIELFDASPDDVESNAQGRNKPILLGQVGIRCRHCSSIPPRHRTRGATYYPAKLHGLYQAAQNMASSHLCHHCQLIPDELRRELELLRDRKSSAGGGKQYWADGVSALGVFEGEGVLRFVDKNSLQKATTDVSTMSIHSQAM